MSQSRRFFCFDHPFDLIVRSPPSPSKPFSPSHPGPSLSSRLRQRVRARGEQVPPGGERPRQRPYKEVRVHADRCGDAFACPHTLRAQPAHPSAPHVCALCAVRTQRGGEGAHAPCSRGCAASLSQTRLRRPRGAGCSKPPKGDNVRFRAVTGRNAPRPLALLDTRG